ncbi:MAG: hypothetical protein AAB791_01945, partial [Patescibacteria group bacterium]
RTEMTARWIRRFLNIMALYHLLTWDKSFVRVELERRVWIWEYGSENRQPLSATIACVMKQAGKMKGRQSFWPGCKIKDGDGSLEAKKTVAKKPLGAIFFAQNTRKESRDDRHE